MTALGDPLVDLGVLLTYWGPTAPPGDQWQSAPFTMRDGWLSRDAIIDRYAQQSGRSVANITFYEIFATFKVAVVIQQLFQRYVQGATRDPRFARFGGRAAYLARQAAARIAGIRAR
jgi:aminoglycoside phosphotransferase (APT) family kinase protein